MSRRCPKKNHLFLNWLKANRHLFQVQPYIVKIKGQNIWGRFTGVTSAIQFHISEDWIEVEVFWGKKFWDMICDIDFSVEQSEQGFFCDLCEPDNVKYYATREALRIEHTFEPFLTWCNETLTANRCLALYEYGGGGCTEARLQKDDKPVENHALKELLQNLKPLPPALKADKDVTQKLSRMIPVFTGCKKKPTCGDQRGLTPFGFQ